MIKVERKRGLEKPRLVHNKKLFWTIIGLGIILIILIIFIVINEKSSNTGNNQNNISVRECAVDGDCVPATCCHSDKCVSINKTPECKGKLCSMDCSGPLDCGTGHCGCVSGKCSIVNDK